MTTLSLRANADLKLSGPFDKAALTGKIGITQSRFTVRSRFSRSGCPESSPTPAAPEAPSFATKKEIGIAAEPFRDWTLDVAIVDDDPFLIRSNLARGRYHLRPQDRWDARRTPIPTGTVQIGRGARHTTIQRMEVTTGTLTFSERMGFDPELNVRGHSRVQDYEINLIVYGRASSPKTIITSDPPLPEAEAISLLATGRKSSDLDNSGALAGDAAILLIDKVRRKFGKGTPLERRPGDLRDTLSFKAGQIDPRTGKRAASASLEITDNVSISAALDVDGNYRGLVKYIIRFR